MSIESKLSLFKEKGYCIAIKPNEFETRDTNRRREAIIHDLKEELSLTGNIGEASTNFDDRFLDSYQIFYNKASVTVEVIYKLSDFVEAITSSNTSSDEKEHIYYRGHSSTNYKLEPSIYREANTKILKSENKIYRDILASRPHFFNDCITTLEKLVKMQHYGIPTRLLDLTNNPLIALYFACAGNEERNGEVLTFNIPEDKFKYFDSDTVSVITNITKCSYDFDISKYNSIKPYIDWMKTEDYDNLRKTESDGYYDEKVREFNNHLRIAELVHFIREDKPYFLNKINPIHLMNFTIVVKPKMTIDRIINQSGAFVLFGINLKKDTCSDCNINKDGSKQKVILIPKDCKSRILNELQIFNINKSTVFGDLDNTAQYFVEKYNY